MPTLSALYRYPLKSAHGHSLMQAELGLAGLPDDRAWMVADERGRFITGRELPQLVTITASAHETGLRLSAPEHGEVYAPREAFVHGHPAHVWGTDFGAWHGADEADAWLSHLLGRPVRLLYTGATQRRARQHPEVPVSFADGYPLLVIGSESLRQLSDWAGRDFEMARFRPNLVVDGAAAFAEDGWTRLRIGEAVVRVTKPCGRCVFTTVDPETGAKSRDQEPIRTLARHRKQGGEVVFGMNAIVETPGRVAAGDAVIPLE
ncbi:MAG TPA: MOSC domain-containing protein [Chitinolyticbacter sp.]|nr:MOSC domain-containing protein [Chitinolyticbacter sp.]